MKLIAVLLIWAGIGLSVPAVPFPQEFVQPDGSRVVVIQKGDERLSWFETVDGYPVVFDRTTGYWYYAVISGGKLVKTPYRVGSVDPDSVGIPRNVGTILKKNQVRILPK